MREGCGQWERGSQLLNQQEQPPGTPALDQDLLCSQRKWRDDKLGGNTRLMPWVWALWQHQHFGDSLLNPEQNHGCQVEVQAWWKIFHWELSTLSTIWSTCAVLAITAFWEGLCASNTGFIGENWPGVAGWCPGSQNPVVLPVSEHYSQSTAMNRHSSAREYCGSSNFLLQMHALLEEKCWGSAGFFFFLISDNLRKEADT